MNAKIGIAFKITTLIFILVLATVLVVSGVSYFLNKSTIEERYEETLRTVANLKTQKIESFFTELKVNIEFATKLNTVREYVEKKSQVSLDELSAQFIPDTSQTIETDLLPEFIDSLQIPEENPSALIQQIEETFLDRDKNLNDLFAQALDYFSITNIYLTDRDGTILFLEGSRERELNLRARSNGEVNFNLIDEDGNTIRAGRDSIYFSNIIANPPLQLDLENSYSVDSVYMHIAAPVKGENGLIGILIYEVNLDYIYQIARDTTGLGKTGETFFTKNQGNGIVYLNPRRFQKKGTFTRTLEPDEVYNRPAQDAALGLEGLGFAPVKFQQEKETVIKEVLAAWTHVPIVDWGLTVHVDQNEVHEPLENLLWGWWGLAFSGGVVLLVSLVLGIVFSQALVRPIIKLREIVNLLSKGVLPETISKPSNDEIGEMTGRLNDLVKNLKNTASFARKIGQGEFQADFNPLSRQDTLGTALLTMRDSIQQSAQRDDERGWIVTGMAEIGDKLPSISSIEELGELVTEYVTTKIGAVQGAFYIVNDDKYGQVIEMAASYAYNKRKYLKAKFRFAEGLVGQAAIEQDTIVRTEIPEDYMSISSGILGDRKPKCILIRPLITNENVFGVLEFAGFERFRSREVEFVEEISEIIARTVFNIKVKENTEKLLRESQKMSSELQEQQEVLRQSAEEMEATQEELQRTNRELENQIREVQRATDRTQLLLENASEVITIYEADATIRYISPSVEKILGYTQDEMIGIRDIAFVHPDGVEAYEQMFKDLIEKPDEKVTIEFSYQTKSSERIWLEATGTNLLSDPAIQGIILNTRDITERRAAEREQRLRGQMQALSENSPDLITRISREGIVFYINPIIETYTGKNKENYLQKHLREIELSKEILGSWNDIVKDVITKNHKVTLDMDFPSVMGERVMQVNAIPEFNDQNSLESVLIVSHDITERKIIELEISQKNRKITESINYAKRIQEAILPDTNYIRQFLKDSFIFYEPRDVVSGDFPWFLQKGDNIYIAAVDCTGHGVPGALISLIGFFLLNNIVNLEEETNPGKILDLLDEAVTKTLKQDESDASTKDGMDISLCKIHTRKQQLEYAGAHRPLYYITDGDLHEIKGNKFPIGGAQYKNRGNFTNTIINYKEGDSFYLFSDGFPDQFGGEKNKKFSPRRIRELIKANHDLPLKEINRILSDAFKKWKGNNKQTDDVLMIGIKL